MAWNDPDNGGGRDPWGRGGDQGPPDLDEVVRKMKDRLGGLFGGRSRRGGGTGSGSGDIPPAAWAVFAVVLLLLIGYSMFHRIEPAERGVVLRFGRYVTTLQPGPHFRLPRPVEDVLKVNVEQIRAYSVDAQMLTGDENIVDVEVAIQYRINNVTDYLFKLSDPDATVARVAESSVREIIGKSTLDFVITEGRAAISQRAYDLIQTILESYQAGIEVTSVNMQPAKPPEEVKAAFDDAIKAREDEQRRINEAEAYRNEVVEKAAGEAARITLQADGYREQIMAEADGEATRFSRLLVEYEKAPEVTRKRLYLEAMEEVLGESSKVIMDVEGGNSLMYLPIDKLVDPQRSSSSSTMLRDLLPEASEFDRAVDDASRERSNSRMRGNR